MGRVGRLRHGRHAIAVAAPRLSKDGAGRKGPRRRSPSVATGHRARLAATVSQPVDDDLAQPPSAAPPPRAASGHRPPVVVPIAIATPRSAAGVPERRRLANRSTRSSQTAGDRPPSPISTGHAAGGAAPQDDVLRRAPLEHHRVDDTVEHDRGEGQLPRRNQFGGQPHRQPRPGRRGPQPEGQSRRGVTSPCGPAETGGRSRRAFTGGRCPGRRSKLSALALAAASVPPTKGSRAPCRTADRRAARQDHRGERGDQQQLDDPRLGKRDVGRRCRRRHGGSGPRPRGRPGSPVVPGVGGLPARQCGGAPGVCVSRQSIPPTGRKTRGAGSRSPRVPARR
jgi:hypothetical protein